MKAHCISQIFSKESSLCLYVLNVSIMLRSICRLELKVWLTINMHRLFVIYSFLRVVDPEMYFNFFFCLQSTVSTSAVSNSVAFGIYVIFEKFMAHLFSTSLNCFKSHTFNIRLIEALSLRGASLSSLSQLIDFYNLK